MCLKLKKGSKRLTAKEDIICYKSLYRNFSIKSGNFHGKPFKGIINDINCEGVIVVEDGYIHFCTNNILLVGNDAKNKLGYKYSWVFDDEVSEIIVDNKDIIIEMFFTPYKQFEVLIGSTYTTELVKEYNEVNIGFHSFVSLKDCKDSNDGNIYVKCIIPKRSKYYKGIFNEYPNYASDTIKYIEIVE